MVSGMVCIFTLTNTTGLFRHSYLSPSKCWGPAAQPVIGEGVCNVVQGPQCAMGGRGSSPRLRLPLSPPGLQTFGQRLYQQYTCYTVFFISIEMCQIADVLIRKTRRLSVFQQGFFRCPQLTQLCSLVPSSRSYQLPISKCQHHML